MPHENEARAACGQRRRPNSAQAQTGEFGVVDDNEDRPCRTATFGLLLLGALRARVEPDQANWQPLRFVQLAAVALGTNGIDTPWSCAFSSFLLPYSSSRHSPSACLLDLRQPSESLKFYPK